MKVLFTIRSLTGGGAERVVSVLSNVMVELGYDTYIVVYNRTDRDYILDERVNVIVMPQRKDSFVTKMQRITDMKNIIKDLGPDVVIPFVGTILYVTWFATLGSNSRFILTIRNNPWEMPESKIQRKFRDFLARKSDKVMIQNEEQAEYFSQKLSNKMVVVNNPVSNDFFENSKELYSARIRTVVTVGRLNPQKNQKLLIQSFAEAFADIQDIHLYIYGEGKEEQSLLNLIDKLEMHGRIKLMGRSLNMYSLLKNTDLFILTSNFEGMPNALMEAMAIGVPCISSDCRTGPKSLIIPRKNGLLFETGSQVDLVKKLKWAVAHPEEMNQMGRNARIYMIDNFANNKVANAIESLVN